ncbi:MAG: LptF/LptG family permease [Chitinophagaceae bacterium]|uniref:LptF/LptG family permease n=1 Tax=unclassified Paraflavitalea TaxID=2798305 RepID=UPI003D34B146|nr:LptF/LptG family permease [Chitinophagaceae bacterium]
MIKKIDWYIIKKFITTTLFMVLVISVIAVVIDTSEKTDDFVKSGLSGFQIITQYFIGFVPFIISMIFPLMSFIAVIFFTSKMSGRSEIVAILASGVPFNRFLRPFFVAAFIMGAVFWVATQFWIPIANGIRGDFQAKYIDSKSSYEMSQNAKLSSNYYLRIDNNTYAGLRSYDTTSKAANQGFFMQRIEGNKVVYSVRADYLRWDTATKGWRLENAVIRTINGSKETIRQESIMQVSLNGIKPSEIRPDKYLKDRMTTPQLRHFIQSEERRGSEGLNTYKVEMYKRDATPFSLFILTIIGAVLASRKTRGGSGLHLAIGIIIAALYVVMDKFSVTFSTKGNFPPLLAAWTPNIVFSFVALYVYQKSPK